MMKTVYTFLIIIIFFTLKLTASNNIDSIAIENVEFPELVEIGDIAIFKCYIVNQTQLPITLDFDLNFKLTTLNNDFSEPQEVETFENVTIEANDSIRVERPIYVNNARAISNSTNLVATWPSFRNGEIGTGTESDFFVANDSVDSIDSVGINGVDGIDGVGVDGENGLIGCDIQIISEHGQTTISGLSQDLQVSIIDQNSVVQYYCSGNCPNDELTVNLPENGIYFVQVTSLVLTPCIDMEVISTGTFNMDELEYPLDDIFHVPAGLGFNLFDLIQSQIDSNLRLIEDVNSQIISLQFDFLNLLLVPFQIQMDFLNNQLGLLQAEIDYLEYILNVLEWNATIDNCAYTEIKYLPELGAVFENGVTLLMPEINPDVYFEFKENFADEWKILTTQNGIALLSQLKTCTAYDVRISYTCTKGKIVSDVVTFETAGCENLCTGDGVEIYKISSFDNCIVLAWDVVPGYNYQLNYKTKTENDWKSYKTPIPYVLLFGLDACTQYEFSVNVICEVGRLSNESNMLSVETGNCKIGEQFVAEIGIDIYPSISTNYISIVNNGIENLKEVSIFDAAGNYVKVVNPNEMNISISDLSRGVYMVTVNVGDKVFINRFIKK